MGGLVSGIGNLITGGGGNETTGASVASPIVGGPPKPGENPQQYQARQMQLYQQGLTPFSQEYSMAGNRAQLPNSNLLNFDQANQVSGNQNMLGAALAQQMGQGINYGAANQTLGQQQGLANQLLQQGQGFGPNPALNQLRMTTNQNVAQQAGMLGSARGMNPALAMRQAGYQGAQANQQAAGQAGLQSAQQQLGAQGQAGSLLGNISGQQIGMAGQNAQTQQGYASLLANLLQGQAGTATQQGIAQGQAGLGLLGANIQQQLGAQQNQLGYQNMIQNAYNSMAGITAGAAAQNAGYQNQMQQGLLGGIAGGLGTLLKLNKGGVVPGYVEGGVVQPFNPEQHETISPEDLRTLQKEFPSLYPQKKPDLRETPTPQGYQDGGWVNPFLYSQQQLMNPYAQSSNSGFGQAMSGLGQKAGGRLGEFLTEQFGKKMDFSRPSLGVDTSFGQPQTPAGLPFNLSGGPDKTPMGNASLSQSPGIMTPAGLMTNPQGATDWDKYETPLAGQFSQDFTNPDIEKALGASKGGKVSGKAKTKGDAKANDTVPALLSPGEAVIPRTAMKSREDAHAFLDQILSQQKVGYGDVLAAKKGLNKNKEHLKKIAKGDPEPMWFGGCSKCGGGMINGMCMGGCAK